MKNNKALFLGVVMTLVLLVACEKQPLESTSVEPIRPVKLFTLTDEQAENVRHFPANVRASEEAVISFRVPGELAQLPVKAAQSVVKGELLARLDDRDYLTEKQLRKTDYELALLEFTRTKKLRKQNALSQSEFDQAQALVRSTKAALQLADDRLSDTTLLAPFAGKIAKVSVDNFLYVQPQQTILILHDDKTLDISIQFPENLLNNIDQKKIDRDYHPTVTFSGTNKQYPVTYKEHATQATPGTQAFEVIFSLAVPDDGQTIYPGMGATINIDLFGVVPKGNKDAPMSFLIPITAMLVDDNTGKNQVWVYRDGQVVPIDVSILRITNNGAVISGNLNSGDKLVSAGLNKMRVGMKVKPLERERGL